MTFFVGENGTGKSTLLEAIARRAGIHIWREGERTRCVVNLYEDKFYRGISIEWVNGPVPGSFFGSSIFQDFARLLDEWAATDPGQLDYFGGKSLLTQSHGQSIMSFFKARYAIRGLYLLDEPETALSPKTQIALLDLLTKHERRRPRPIPHRHALARSCWPVPAPRSTASTTPPSRRPLRGNRPLPSLQTIHERSPRASGAG